MKKLVGIIFFLVIISGNMTAQNTNENNSVVISNARIDTLVQLHIEHNKKYPVVQGYRIQILMASGNDALDITEEAKTIFLEKYPNTPAYLTFDEPDYRVRVGDFRTRLNAEKFLDKINRKYPGAWVIQDYINFPEY
jgi:hypothetical protein